MRLFAITPNIDIKDEQKYLVELIAEGFIVHCRKPDKSAVELAGYLRHIPPEFRPAISIHSHHEIAEDMGISRLHYTEEARRKLNPDEYKYGRYKLSTSIHDMNSLKDENLRLFDYIFCSPVFDSISKKDYKANKNCQQVIGEEYPFDLIALGGITADKLQKIYEWNYDGAAFGGYLWDDPKRIRERFTKIKEVWLNDLLL